MEQRYSWLSTADISGHYGTPPLKHRRVNWDTLRNVYNYSGRLTFDGFAAVSDEVGEARRFLDNFPLWFATAARRVDLTLGADDSSFGTSFAFAGGSS